MDPLSFAASLIAVIGTAAETYKGLEKLRALRRAPDELLVIINEISTLRSVLRAVEIALRSHAKTASVNLQTTLEDIELLSSQIASVLYEIDILVQNKLKAPERRRSAGPDSQVGVNKISWLYNQKKLSRLRHRLSDMTSTLTAILSALNSAQLAKFHEPRSMQLAIQEITLLDIAGRPSSKSDLSGPVIAQLGEAVNMSKVPLPRINTALTRPQLDPLEPTEPDSFLKAEDYNLSESPTEYHSPVDSFSNIPSRYPPTSPGAVKIVASLGSEKCRQFCQCQCHVSTRYQTPEWAKAFIGMFQFLSNMSIALGRRPCDQPVNCKRSGATSAQFTYYAPAWAFARAFTFSAVSRDLLGLGASISVAIPRVVDWLDPGIIALQHDNLDALRSQMMKGISSIYDVDPMGLSLLHRAARRNSVEMCTFLLEQGADRMACTSLGVPAYAYALHHILSHIKTTKPPKVAVEVIEALAVLFADDETYIDMGFTPVHRIVVGLASADLDNFLELSLSDLDTQDISGKTPLMYAAARGDAYTIRTLLRWGARHDIVDRSLRRALNYAVSDGTDECVKILLEAGAYPDGDDLTEPPLGDLFGCPYERVATINALVEYGANVNCNSLPWLCNCKGPGVIPNAQCLIENGANINTDSDGDSVVAHAITENNVPLLRLLIDNGAKVEIAPPRFGILNVAAIIGTLEVWSVLAEYAWAGKLGPVDWERRHKGHDVWTCLQICRPLNIRDKRVPYDVEQERFQELVDAIKASCEKYDDLASLKAARNKED